MALVYNLIEFTDGKRAYQEVVDGVTTRILNSAGHLLYAVPAFRVIQAGVQPTSIDMTASEVS